MRFISRTRALACPPDVSIRGKSVGFNSPHLMGILNVTPDSFSDGGRFTNLDRAIAHAELMCSQGATFIDIGGESTRPGADPVSAEEEIRRVVPVVEAVAALGVFVSIDTTKASVAAAALDAGADLVNDISGFGFDPDMPAIVAQFGVPVVLMHICGEPKTMQDAPRYEDVVDEVCSYFDERVALAIQSGVAESQIILDPGIGFGKTVEQNYELLRRLDELTKFGRPILLGTSRKSLIGAVLNRPPEQRVWGTAATIAWGVCAGADILRVHDVGEMADVIKVATRIRQQD